MWSPITAIVVIVSGQRLVGLPDITPLAAIPVMCAIVLTLSTKKYLKSPFHGHCCTSEQQASTEDAKGNAYSHDNEDTWNEGRHYASTFSVNIKAWGHCCIDTPGSQ